jgi:sigma-B regulation protein RsbU (phosphoserine phosphatase)
MLRTAAGGAPVRPTLTYAPTTTKLAPGECLFLFTDGITESMNGGRRLLLEERLERALESLAGQAPRAIVEAVLGAVLEFRAAAAQSDDIAALAIRRVTW